MVSPHFSPVIYCGRRCTAPSGTFSLRGAPTHAGRSATCPASPGVPSGQRAMSLRTVKYASAPLRSKTPLGTAPRRPRNENR